MASLDTRIINERNAHAIGVAITQHNPIMLELLEGLVDGSGLGQRQGFSDFLNSLADVADIKAAHVQETWQDTTLAQRYVLTSQHLRDLAKTTHKRFG
jgi:hypothetical protein